MTKRRRQHDRDTDLRLPRDLIDDLVALHEVPASVPPAVDDKIAEMAYHHCEAVRTRRRIRRWGWIGAAAAVVFFLIWLHGALQGPEIVTDAPPPLAGIRDIDRSGRVDILDAFALARHIEKGRQLDPSWDVNHDGTIDQADVDTVATTAVRLDKGAP
ncbi:MAG: hypothetical protein JXQ73_15665 [Phycisphaerae bacterium]|nr:hypothetical protein [Phycisphaerae bacterium]